MNYSMISSRTAARYLASVVLAMSSSCRCLQECPPNTSGFLELCGSLAQENGQTNLELEVTGGPMNSEMGLLVLVGDYDIGKPRADDPLPFAVYAKTRMPWSTSFSQGSFSTDPLPVLVLLYDPIKNVCWAAEGIYGIEAPKKSSVRFEKIKVSTKVQQHLANIDIHSLLGKVEILQPQVGGTVGFGDLFEDLYPMIPAASDPLMVRRDPSHEYPTPTKCWFWVTSQYPITGNTWDEDDACHYDAKPEDGEFKIIEFSDQENARVVKDSQTWLYCLVEYHEDGLPRYWRYIGPRSSQTPVIPPNTVNIPQFRKLFGSVGAGPTL